jgi:hypothetical protein
MTRFSSNPGAPVDLVTPTVPCSAAPFMDLDRIADYDMMLMDAGYFGIPEFEYGVHLLCPPSTLLGSFLTS